MGDPMEKEKRIKTGVVVKLENIGAHDLEGEEDVLNTSHESLEVDDEILKKATPKQPGRPGKSSQQAMHLKKEKWKYKTRKKRKKSNASLDGLREALNSDLQQMDALRVTKRSRSNEEESSSVDIVDFDLIAARSKYLKLDMQKRQSAYGQKLFKQINQKKLDSGGNSENHSGSEDSKKRRASWRDQTAECDVCGKEMLRTRLKKHVRTAHKSPKLYPCDECSYNAPNLVELKLHLRKRHKLSMATVMKMIKFMKVNRKHRRSMIEDEGEDESPKPRNKRLLGLDSTIKDELHQTGSEAENRQGRKRIDYREPSSDKEDDAVDRHPVYNNEIKDTNIVVKEEVKDSGIESQPTSQDEETKENPEEVLARIRKLSTEELSEKGSRYRSPAQIEQLTAFFAVCSRPSKEQEAELGDKLGMDWKQLHDWFGHTRRKEERSSRESVGLRVEVEEEDTEEQRQRAARGQKTLGLLMSAPSANTGMYVEYSEDKILPSPASFDDVIQGGGAVCIGVDINVQKNQCLLCEWSCSFRGNLYKHIRVHGFDPKCCTMPRKESELPKGNKGCRKTFTMESFDLHICTDGHPVHFNGTTSALVQPSGGRPVKARKEGGSWDSSDEEDDEELKAIVNQLKEEGKGVCLGYEPVETLSMCLLCDFKTAHRGNLFQHIKRHYNQEVKFCAGARQPTEMEDSKRGCRKVYLKVSFDQHTCTSEAAKPLGNFPFKPLGGANRKKDKKKKAGGYRGFEKNFGVPDGSPAKFHSDRYLRVFSQLGVRDPGERMDSAFRWQLDYLTNGQMTAVQDYVNNPGEKFYLVRGAFVFTVMFGLSRDVDIVQCVPGKFWAFFVLLCRALWVVHWLVRMCWRQRFIPRTGGRGG